MHMYVHKNNRIGSFTLHLRVILKASAVIELSIEIQTINIKHLDYSFSVLYA